MKRVNRNTIEPSEKGTHAIESMMLKMFYLCGFVRWTKCIWWAIENSICSFISFWVCCWMNFKKWLFKNKITNSSIQKITCITAIADTKMISMFCVPEVLHFLPKSAVQIKIVSSAWLYFLLESTTEEKES